ncbi:solute carrier family 34 (sodium-dependent phosphate cotransporter) [Cyclobacterium lianum]|uniref:Solute carrier family 34 (Sodium-dependent phosphate cotransporter) n=1 Tax=Cyclobacterium lianum TaxID=388280 RepID=A0A1M7PSH8_9BACT|nr:Na/Pi symporter [Cyclobacterium lianum]SHN20370.1 solute carrier family 34 (sodium-dependent phosphate cotransporter) [Cyclobacterium lianum]
MNTTPYNNSLKKNVLTISTVVLGLLFFMFSIDFLTYALAKLNNEMANTLFMATINPFVGLFIGLLTTALIQSSSTVSAMVVVLVASGNLSLAQAVPLIMGANIGTTLTSTLVAFGYIMKKKSFRKALSAGVLHDIFNIISVIILLPLEIYFGMLSKTAAWITQAFVSDSRLLPGEAAYQGFFLRPVSIYLAELLHWPLLSLLTGILILIGSIKLLSSLAYKSLITPNFKKIKKHIFNIPTRSFLYGMFFTAAVQSSTITTSLMVTAVATGKVALRKVFPFIMGANVGTTITAVIAAFYKTEAAISIAIVHVLFNLIGTLIFLPHPGLRGIPVRLAKHFGRTTANTRLVGFAYILLTFFIIPFFLIYFNQSESPARPIEPPKNPVVGEISQTEVDPPDRLP